MRRGVRDPGGGSFGRGSIFPPPDSYRQYFFPRDHGLEHDLEFGTGGIQLGGSGLPGGFDLPDREFFHPEHDQPSSPPAGKNQQPLGQCSDRRLAAPVESVDLDRRNRAGGGSRPPGHGQHPVRSGPSPARSGGGLRAGLVSAAAGPQRAGSLPDPDRRKRRGDRCHHAGRPGQAGAHLDHDHRRPGGVADAGYFHRRRIGLWGHRRHRGRLRGQGPAGQFLRRNDDLPGSALRGGGLDPFTGQGNRGHGGGHRLAVDPHPNLRCPAAVCSKRRIFHHLGAEPQPHDPPPHLRGDRHPL